MTDETIEQKVDSEKPDEESEESKKPKTDSELVQERTEQLKAGNALMENELLKQQELIAKTKLAGQSNIAPNDAPTETPKDYAQRIMGVK